MIQKRIQAKLLTKQAKVEVLLQYWDQVQDRIIAKATKLNDTKTLKMMKLMSDVPIEVREAVLARYVECCKTLHSVAFM